jgi:hypothetical protein
VSLQDELAYCLDSLLSAHLADLLSRLMMQQRSFSLRGSQAEHWTRSRPRVDCSLQGSCLEHWFLVQVRAPTYYLAMMENQRFAFPR